jgi:hypothetical protein
MTYPYRKRYSGVIDFHCHYVCLRYYLYAFSSQLDDRGGSH